MFIPINKGQFTLETQERIDAFNIKRGYGVLEDFFKNRRQWVDFPKNQYVADYPLHIDIELSSLCNLQCPMCYTITDQFKTKVNTQLMDYDLFKKIVDECAVGDVYSIRLSLRGESFLHPRIVECVNYAKTKGIKEVSTLTNGYRLDEELFTQVMHAGLDWITISFDGLGKTYEKIRHPATYERAVQKVTNYFGIKKKYRFIKPVIKVQSIYPAIKDNPSAYYEVFAPITDMVSANPLIDYLKKDTGQVVQYEKNFSCPQLYQRLAVGADGKIMMCSNDIENEQVLGNAYTQTIHEMWHCTKLERARSIHKLHKGIKEYNVCSKCYLPRKTESSIVTIDNKEIIAENYVNRSQVIGS